MSKQNGGQQLVITLEAESLAQGLEIYKMHFLLVKDFCKRPK